MKIKVRIEPFLRVVSKAQGIVERRSNMPILSCVLLTAKDRRLFVSATDLQLGLEDSLDAEVISEGAATISGKKLLEILRESPARDSGGAIYIKGEPNNWVLLSDGKAKFKLAGFPPEEFPSFLPSGPGSEFEDCVMVELDPITLNEMIKKTIYAVTLEEAGFKLSGLFTEKITKDDKTYLRMVGTDGHRLSLIDKSFISDSSQKSPLEELELPKGVMLPKKGVTEISKLASLSDEDAGDGLIKLGFKHSSCIVSRGSAVLAIRLLDTKFPDYHAVIPEKMDYSVGVDRGEFLSAMKRMLIMSSERYRAVKMTLEDNTLTLVSANPELGEVEEKIGVSWTGPTMELAFNARYFVDVLQVMESEEVEMGFIDNSKPCVITGQADQGFLGLIMPMRL